jgi:hypothetical protein
LIDLFQKREPLRDYFKTNQFLKKRQREPYRSENLSVFVKSAIRTAKNFIFLKLNNAVRAKRTAQISVFNDFSYKNASRFSNKFHQNKLFNIKITKNGQCFGKVRFALLRKISA